MWTTRSILRVLLCAVLILSGALVSAWGASPQSPGELVVRVGASVPLTGPIAGQGRETERSLRMAEAKINEEGIKAGDKKYRLEILIDDNAYAAEKAVGVINKHLFSDKLDIVFTWGTTAVNAVQPISEKAGVLNFIFSTPMEHISTKNPWSFRFMQSGFEYGGPYVKWVSMNRPNIKRVLLIYPDEASQIAIRNAYTKAFEYYKIEVLDEIRHDRKEKEYYSIIERAMKVKPDAIFTSGSGPVGNLIKQLREKGFTGEIVTWTSGAEDLIRLAGAGMEGTLGMSSEVGSPIMPRGVTEFMLEYQKKYHAAPSTYALEWYCKPIVLASAIRIAGSPDIKKLREVLETKEVNSPWGKIRFGGELVYGINHQAFFPSFVSQFKEGRFRILYVIQPTEVQETMMLLYKKK